MPYLEANQKIKVISVSEFTRLVNETVFEIEPVWIEGEVSNFKNWQGRWIFFSLKDELAVLNCNVSKYRFESFGFELEDGMKIRVLGRPELRYKGEFTLNVEEIQLWGEGALKKAYELLKKKLELEGLFVRKRKIPDFAQNIGLITSKSGVVIHDFLKNLKPFGFKIYFHDARLEGAEAVFSLIGAIKWFNENMPNLDVLVIARGGGSLEKLQAFNNEILARAIFASNIPVLSGIGHEVDVPIASLVADVSVSTPTAAAIHLNQFWESLQKRLPYLEEKLLDNFGDCLELTLDKTQELSEDILNNFEKLIKENKSKLNLLVEKIISDFSRVFNIFNSLTREIKNNFENLSRKKIEIEEKVKAISKDILQYLENSIKEKRDFILNKEKQLAILNPERNLKLGYSIVFDQKNKVIKEITKIKIGDILTTKLYKGRFSSKVKKIEKEVK